ncbi:MAG: hypothetical protein ACOC9W_03875 [Persicimonas sp.]
MQVQHDSSKLLAIDLGIRSGFALYGDDGRLIRYRSTNFGSRSRLKKAAWGVLRDIDGLERVVAEGDTGLGEIWQKQAEKFDASFELISAEDWREGLMYDRYRRSGSDAKERADTLARQVIESSGADRPTSLRHDAAEAILIGLWAVLDIGWLSENPLED